MGANPSGQAVPDGHLRPGPEPIETPTTPLQVAPESPPAPQPAPSPQAAAPVQTSVFSGAGDQCPSCGTHMAADQRYCLACGTRRGDPRLPFMDAVSFMDASKQPQGGGAAAAPPPPPRERKPRLSANASLIAGVGTLILAIGVGVLIGRSGESSNSTANTAPQVIKVEGGGTASTGTTETESPAETEGSKGATGSAGSGKSGKANKQAAKEKSEVGSSGATKATEEVLKPSGNVKMAPPKVQKGGACEPGSAGCGSNGKFSGSFFE